ncbi:MAG: chitobiase/beta-hexosaminidase C-terminal domain-containing protein [Cyclobacteriaceae bacterium]
MERFYKVVTNVAFLLLCLLTMLLVFEDYVQIPFWIQPLGRMHPLILHLPIGFIVLLVLINLFRKKLEEASYTKLNGALLLLTTLVTILAAIMGLFLSQEDGYTSNLMAIHKWAGVATSYVLYGLMFMTTRPSIYRTLLYVGFLSMVLTGHFGAGLTHGTDFLTEPIANRPGSEVDEASPIFSAHIQPILERKCVSCHNDQKHKGDLNLSTLAGIRRGGENGSVWIANDGEQSEIIRRAHLPIENEDHMPPEGKTQLTEEELELMKTWIDNGANESISLQELNKSDELFRLISSKRVSHESKYSFRFADEDLVASLNIPYRSVRQKSPKSPAIEVSIFGRKTYKEEFLKNLLPIKEQVVSLNLSHLPIEDGAVKLIGEFANLERLNLNFTDIEGTTLAGLQRCSKLESLSISGTAVDSGAVDELIQLAGLNELYLWNTRIPRSQIERLESSMSETSIIRGYQADTEEAIRLTPPVLGDKRTIITSSDQISLEHKLSDVLIRYTLDGSDPDSTSLIYQSPFQFESNVTLKARSFKEGWIGSEVRSFSLTQKGLIPEKVELVHKPHVKYKGNGAATLTDDVRGTSSDILSNDWLGFIDGPLIAIVDFGEQAPKLDEIAVSYGVGRWLRIVPPESIEIWGGDKTDEWVLIKKHRPIYVKSSPSSTVDKFTFSSKGLSFQYYKIVANPVNKLPDWQKSKGKKGWVFVDQIFFYGS